MSHGTMLDTPSMLSEAADSSAAETPTTEPRRGGRRELYGALFRSATPPPEVPHEPVTAPALVPVPAAAVASQSVAQVVSPPARPRSLAETGLTLAQLADLTLKVVYLHGSLTSGDICRQVRLPFNVLEEALTYLRQVRCLEVQSGEMLGQLTYRFHLSDEGRSRAREAFEQCRYVGPAPVSLRSYVAQCRRQRVAGVACTAERLQAAFDGLLLRPYLLDELGPAVCDGQAIFLYGPPGNGKSLIARRIGRFLNTDGGDIYVPYAVHVDGAIVTVFDPNVHQTTDDADDGLLAAADAHNTSPSGATRGDAERDARWRRVRRPVVMTAGELTLDMLDLRYHTESRYYTAPMHLKSNGGVFVIDDFGRQQVAPRELLNRWILPLAERIDYLTLATGKKFAVPFDQLVIFSTNLDPQALVDDAFLRRIRHKLAVAPPSREQFSRLFEQCCVERGLRFEPECVGYLFSNRYSLTSSPRWSDPQDLLEVLTCICRFRGEEPRLSRELVAEAARRFFGVESR